jgi:hypothetical protein
MHSSVQDNAFLIIEKTEPITRVSLKNKRGIALYAKKEDPRAYQKRHSEGCATVSAAQ